MEHNIYISALSAYLTKLYGLQTTNKILLRILYIEKTIKFRGYEKIKTNEYFFLLYYVFRHVETTLSVCLGAIDAMELVAYIVYSYFGPSTSYCANIFFTHAHIKTNIITILLNTDLACKLMNLSTDAAYYDYEVKQFLFYNNNNIY